jgi:hypothetical protein
MYEKMKSYPSDGCNLFYRDCFRCYLVWAPIKFATFFQLQQPIQFTYAPQETTDGAAFAPISAVTAAINAAPNSVAATDVTEDTDSQTSADTLVDQFVASSAAAAAEEEATTIQLDDIASAAAMHHGIS